MGTATRRLHDYFRSSAAYRVRIALQLKGLDYRHIGVHLVRGGGEQLSAEYRRINSLGLVPTFHEGDFSLTQSLAIIEYLDERYPEVPVLPRDIEQRAWARQIALTVACDIHPVNNLRVMKRLTEQFGADEAGKKEWMVHWIELGFSAVNELLSSQAAPGRFCVGDAPSLADCCLIPQVFNAQRFGVDLTPYARIQQIAATCAELAAFQQAHPSRQPDSE